MTFAEILINIMKDKPEVINFFDYLFYKEEKYITIEEICKAIKDCRHNTEFYFQCGVAAANIAANINTVRNYSDLSIAIDGYNMYKDFICLEDNYWFYFTKALAKTFVKKVLGFI